MFPKLILFGSKNSIKSYKAQIVAQYSNQNLVIEYIEDNKNSTTDMILEIGDIKICNSSAIAYYLSDTNLKCENDLFGFCEILQWISYTDNHLLPAVAGWILSSSRITLPKNIKLDGKTSKEEALNSLKKLNDMLLRKTYFVNERISLADIVIFSALLPLYEHILTSELRKQYTNLNRWFSTMLNQAEVKAVVKDFHFCTKALKG